MKIKAWIDDGIVRCASQMCDDCSFLETKRCQDAIIVTSEYWKNICEIWEHQKEKGLNKYKMSLEENTLMDMETRIRYMEEEAIDMLMYMEHIKTMLREIK